MLKKNIHCTQLKNGLRVATDRMEHVASVSIGIWVNKGSLHELAHQQGLSHFLEHMAFKGTASRSAVQIAEAIESVGGHINAYTSREHTVYYCKVLKEHTSLAIEIIADILQHSVFDAAELERERNVILQEIASADDTPEDALFENHQLLAFPDQPLGRSILGTISHINAFSRDDLYNYAQEAHQGKNLVLALAGAIDHAECVALAEKFFIDIPVPNTPSLSVNTIPLYQGGTSFITRPLEQLHIALSYQAASYNDPHFYTQQLLAYILGGGMSSRLFQEIREKRGLAYSISSFYHAFSNTALLGLYVGTSNEHINMLFPLIKEVLHTMEKHITREEIQRVKTQYRASLLMGQEYTGVRSEALGRDFSCYNRYISFEETESMLNDIQPEHICAQMRHILHTQKPSLSILGPLPKGKKIRESFYKAIV